MIGWIYLAGFILLWRHHMGYALDEVGDDDGADFAFALFFGTFACLFWPLTLMGRGIYVVWHKYMADDTAILSNFFPRPKEIETRAERAERKQREAKLAIQVAREQVNNHERENGIELTVWEKD